MRNTDAFVFQWVRPRIGKCVMTNSATFRNAAMHGLWYVSVHKDGGVYEESNFSPWRDYHPKKEWLVSLCAQKKLTHDQYEALSALFRDGHAARMTDLAAVRRTERPLAIRQHVCRQSALMLASSAKAYKTFPEVEEFVGLCHAGANMARRPILVIIGATNLGKSMLAVHILQRVARILVCC